VRRDELAIPIGIGHFLTGVVDTSILPGKQFVTKKGRWWRGRAPGRAQRGNVG